MPTPTNVLVFFTDDHAQWAAGTYGNRELRTPTLDYLAATGLRMDQAFTPTPVCSPARACFLTGRLASQHGIHDYLSSTDPKIDHRAWLADERLLPKILGDAGYQTALIGKWHLGRDDQAHPAFDTWYSLSGDFPYHHFGRIRYCDNGRDDFKTGYPTDVLTDKAIAFLRDRDEQKPFFLFIGYTATHSPWAEQPGRLAAHYRKSAFSDIPSGESYPFGRPALESLSVDQAGAREALAQYYAAVSHIDEAAGRLVDELEALDLRKSTLIIYTADHGLNCGHHGIWGKGNGTLPLNMLEESIRVPLILNQPGSVAAGQTADCLVDHTDLFQTILDHCAIRLPAAAAADYPGSSFQPLLNTGSAAYAGKEIQFGEYGPLRMARTSRYKLIGRYPHDPTGELAEDVRWEFFDRQTDPREEVNCYERPEYQAVIEALREAIGRFFGHYEDPHKSGLLGRQLPQYNFTEAWRLAEIGPI